MISNIFLDFLNRDSRQIFGLFTNVPKELHISLLTDALNAAVFLCDEYCLLPPGFLAECELAREAVLTRSDYVTQRLIRLPLREESLDDFWEKKRREYYPFRRRYPGLFDPRNELLLRKFGQAIISRQSRIADEILRTWEEGPDVAGIWRGTMPLFTPPEIEMVREIPRRIRYDGVAVTWAAISRQIKTLVHNESAVFRKILQHDYFSIYLAEFGLVLLTRLPFARVEFVPGTTDLTNDYEALRAALKALNVWTIIAGLSAESMISLRSKAGYYEFRRAFDLVATEASSTWDVGLAFARSSKRVRPSRGMRQALEVYHSGVAPPRGYELREGEIRALADCLGVGREAEQEFAIIADERIGAKKRMSTPNRPRVAIFVALEMERKYLIQRWKLAGKYPEQVYRGRLNDLDILLYGPDEMGRVSAAVSTVRFLFEHPKPDMLIVTGIAGGFERQGVHKGDVLVASSVADLASRKIRQAEHVLPEFRPQEFRTDERFGKYVRSGSFDDRAWEQAVIAEAEWPAGLRPTIHHGPVASLDEVVSSREWVETLCSAWPKLLGVEMEAGGVCAAAVAQGKVDVTVVRAVSDLADPSKSDDAWRRIAIKTVAHLLESVVKADVLAVEH